MHHLEVQKWASVSMKRTSPALPPSQIMTSCFTLEMHSTVCDLFINCDLVMNGFSRQILIKSSVTSLGLKQMSISNYGMWSHSVFHFCFGWHTHLFYIPICPVRRDRISFCTVSINSYSITSTLKFLPLTLKTCTQHLNHWESFSVFFWLISRPYLFNFCWAKRILSKWTLKTHISGRWCGYNLLSLYMYFVFCYQYILSINYQYTFCWNSVKKLDKLTTGECLLLKVPLGSKISFSSLDV